MLIGIVIAGALAGWALADWTETGLVLGALAGAVVGWWLRRAVRGEIAAAVAPLAAELSLLRAGALPQPLVTAPAPVRAEPSPAAEPEPYVFEPYVPAAPAAPRAPGVAATMLAAVRTRLFGGNTVVRAGLAVLFVGLSFLASWAASAGLFPIELRLALVAAVGVALLATGFRTRLRRPAFGVALQGGGVAAIYLALFAAMRLFGLVPVGLAFALMVAVCALGAALALLQRAQALAVTAFAGGFAAPLLLPGDNGPMWLLFGYITLLNLAILGLVARAAWRGLALLGFVVTFGLASLWGWAEYRPELFATAQVFLAANVLIFLGVGVVYTRGTPGRTGRVVDTTLLFGPALAGFGLEAGLVGDRPFGAAFAALGFATLYVGAAVLAARARRTDMRVMNEALLAIGIGFLTAAVPLALGARWTSSAWALEGAGAFWIGLRQARWTPRAFGLALQAGATLLFWSELARPVSPVPFAHPAFVGAMLAAVGWLLTAWWLRGGALPADAKSRLAAAYGRAERRLGAPAFLLGFGLWCVGWSAEAFRALPPRVMGDAVVPVLAQATALLLATLAVLASARGGQWLADRLRWPVAAWPALGTVVALAVAVAGTAGMPVLSLPAAPIWAALIALHARMLWVNDHRPPPGAAVRGLVRAAHVGGVWLALALAVNILWFAADGAGLWHTSWAGVAFLVGAIAALAGLTRWTAPALAGATRRWPLDLHAADYGWWAAAPIALLVGAGAAIVALVEPGRTDPLPFVPLLNPVDLSLALAIAVLALWRRAVLAAQPALPGVEALAGPAAPGLLGALAFLALNTAWGRVGHHLLGVAWTPDALLGSVVVQTGLAILWTLVALGLMVAGGRRAARGPWLAGAGLLGLTVVKLLLVDMDATGGGARIVAFIGVGLLMLVVGYLAPLPPRRGEAMA